MKDPGPNDGEGAVIEMKNPSKGRGKCSWALKDEKRRSQFDRCSGVAPGCGPGLTV